jgi:prepilin-type processing-associated H-X9-DG protein
MYRIIGADGKEYGPVTQEQLRAWIAEGRVNAQTRIQAEGSPDWKPLAAFPEFAPTAAPPPIAPPPAGAAKTSGWAISSLVLAVLALMSCGLTALPGLILGIVGLQKIKRSGGQLGGQGLAIAGICVSGAALLMLPIYAGIALPALSSAREKARQAQCMNNLRQLSLAVAMYADQNKGVAPTGSNWCDALKPNLGSGEKVFQCMAGKGERCSYAFNANMSGGEWGFESDVVLLIDAPLGWNGTVSGPKSLPKSPHRRGYNVLFNDGHVELVTAERLQMLKWTTQQKSR